MAAASAVVSERFPGCAAALLGGSVLTPFRTDRSDLDLVVVGIPGAPYKETFSSHGFTVELFAHTPASLSKELWRQSLGGEMPWLLNIVADSEILTSEGGLGERLRDEARAYIAQGPPQLSKAAIDEKRYWLTNLLEDLEASDRPTEIPYIAAIALQSAATYYLAFHRKWIAGGKMLDRALRQADPELADALLAAYAQCLAGEPKPFIDVISSSVLDPYGGRLLLGYRTAKEPSTMARAGRLARRVVREFTLRVGSRFGR